jgi:hypothetical protein
MFSFSSTFSAHRDVICEEQTMLYGTKVIKLLFLRTSCKVFIIVQCNAASMEKMEKIA